MRESGARFLWDNYTGDLKKGVIGSAEVAIGCFCIFLGATFVCKGGRILINSSNGSCEGIEKESFYDNV